MIHLTVVEPFGSYARGALITDANEVAAVLAGENAHHVVKRIVERPAEKRAEMTKANVKAKE